MLAERLKFSVFPSQEFFGGHAMSHSETRTRLILDRYLQAKKLTNSYKKMKRLKLLNVIPGSYQKDQKVIERLKLFNNAIVELTDEKIIITLDNFKFSSKLKKTEEDLTTETFQGSYEDGSSFRLVRPNTVAKKMLSAKGYGDSVTFGGMTGDGYAVNFDLVELADSEYIKKYLNSPTEKIKRFFNNFFKN